MFGSSKQLAFLPMLFFFFFFPRYFEFLCLFLAENTAFIKKKKKVIASNCFVGLAVKAEEGRCWMSQAVPEGSCFPWRFVPPAANWETLFVLYLVQSQRVS